MSAYYETDRAVSEYLLFHFGTELDSMPWECGPAAGLRFPERCVEFALAHGPLQEPARALDLGCAVGRTSFELSRHCTEVIGVDTSAKLIETAQRLAQTGHVHFEMHHSGEHHDHRTASLPSGVRADRIRFQVGDALDLPSDLGRFDLVVAANLLDRVPRPHDLLRSLPARLKPGGRLLLTSPYTWLEEYTPRDRWITTQESSAIEHLGPLLAGLRLLDRADLPFLLREHYRKYQWAVSEATLWSQA